MLKSRIPPGGLSSDDPRFTAIVGDGYSTRNLQASWAANPNATLTCCNAFAGWVARETVAKGVLASCKMDLSGVDREVPGSWICANSGEAITANLHPLPGDFACWGTIAVLKPGRNPDVLSHHVGIIVEIDPITLAWKWVAGGQGGRSVGRDYIKWGPWKIDQSRTFNRAAIAGWVDIGQYFFPNGPEQ
jgi:hypothetical protein